MHSGLRFANHHQPSKNGFRPMGHMNYRRGTRFLQREVTIHSYSYPSPIRRPSSSHLWIQRPKIHQAARSNGQEAQIAEEPEGELLFLFLDETAINIGA